MTLREQLRLRMRRVGLTQNKLAELLNTNKTTISLYFNKGAYPDLTALIGKAIIDYKVEK